LKVQIVNTLISFVPDYWRYVLKGGAKFYSWMGLLAVLSCIAMYGGGLGT